MKLLITVWAALLALAFWNMPAFAQAATTTVVIPWGDWLAAIINESGPVLLAIALWLIRKLPAAWLSEQNIKRIDHLLDRAISYGINTVAGAAKGKELSADVGSEVVAQALNYAIEHGPGSLVGWAGGENGIREKIIARLSLKPDAALGTVNPL